MRNPAAFVFFALFVSAAGAQAPSPPVPLGAPHDCKGHYPPDAADAQGGGRTVVGFTVTPQGGVTAPAIVRSSGHADLDEAAMACVRSWRYQPVLADGQPVAAPTKVVVVWVPEPPQSPLAAQLRVVRKEAWNCLWSSAATKGLPDDFAARLEVHVAFSSLFKPTEVTLKLSSGNAELDSAALACVRAAPSLAEAEKLKGTAAAANVRLAWWHSAR